MHNGINTNYYLAIGAEKTSGIQLLFKSGERQVYNMLLSAFCDGKGDFIFWIEIGNVTDLQSPEFIHSGNKKAGAVAFFLLLQALN